MISGAELTVQRKLSRAFIQADGIVVVLMRSVWTPDGAGGEIKSPPAPVPAQQFRLIPQQDTVRSRFTADGEQVEPEYVLLGEHDVDVQRWDQFMHDGRRFEVLYVENKQYEVKAEVAYRGD